jgi:hypothetical protein
MRAILLTFALTRFDGKHHLRAGALGPASREFV